LIVGLLFIVLGLGILFVPVQEYQDLAVLFSSSFIISGIVEIYFSVKNKDALDGSGWYLTCGVLSLIIGIILFAYRDIPAPTLPLIIGFSLFTKSFEGFGLALDVHFNGMMHWRNYAFTTVVATISAFLLLVYPVVSWISIVVLTALAYIFLGISAVVLTVDLSKLGGRATS
jgi:uncharacterized membrane protein HdeD (DUF308 family)